MCLNDCQKEFRNDDLATRPNMGVCVLFRTHTQQLQIDRKSKYTTHPNYLTTWEKKTGLSFSLFSRLNNKIPAGWPSFMSFSTRCFLKGGKSKEKRPLCILYVLRCVFEEKSSGVDSRLSARESSTHWMHRWVLWPLIARFILKTNHSSYFLVCVFILFFNWFDWINLMIILINKATLQRHLLTWWRNIDLKISQCAVLSLLVWQSK
jgi:hypothetical protein